MFIERSRLVQLNKHIFGGGINQTKKLTPDYIRMVMPDPSLPKIKRFNIKSNNPLGYLMNMNNQPMPIQSQMQPDNQIIDNQPPEIEEQQQEQDIISQNISQQPKEEIKESIQEEEAPISQPVETAPTTKKYVIIDLGENNIQLPPGYSTDDEYEYKLINLINEPKEKFELAIESKNGKVYKRSGENNIIIIKTYGKIPYPLSKIRPVLNDAPGMDKWDKTFKKHELIETYPKENGMSKVIVYLYLKMPVFMTDREIIQETKVWSEYNENPNNYLSLMRSTTHSKYPVKEKPIRAEMVIGGMYLKEISPQETLIYMINSLDLKITTGKDIVDSQAPKKGRDFVDNLIKFLGKN